MHSIVIDLSTVEYITSWGIGILVRDFTTTSNRNSKLSLSGISTKVREILSKVNLDNVFYFSDMSN